LEKAGPHRHLVDKSTIANDDQLAFDEEAMQSRMPKIPYL
jgi:hypothetical protein